MNSIFFRIPREAAPAPTLSFTPRGSAWKAGLRLTLCLGALPFATAAHAQGTFVPTTVTVEADPVITRGATKIATPTNGVTSRQHQVSQIHAPEARETSLRFPSVAASSAPVYSQRSNAQSDALAPNARRVNTAETLPQLPVRVASGAQFNLAAALVGDFSISGLVEVSDGAGATMPLVDATVTLLETGQSVKTDDLGNYVLDNLPAGSYTVGVSVPLGGFASQTKSVTVDSSQVVNFVLEPKATYNIGGRVVDESGNPLADVAVFVNNAPNPSATTTANGTYTLSGLDAGTYTITAVKNGYTITASPVGAGTLTLPTTGTTDSPGGMVNFVAVDNGPDTDAPTVFLDTPVDGDTVTFSSGAGTFVTATGSATDETGIANLYFTLARQQGRKLQYYNFTKRNWTSKANAAGVVLTRNVSGVTELNYAQVLPKLGKGTYILTVSGRDTLGNVSDGSADAVATFTVEKVKVKGKGKQASPSAPKS